MRRLSISFMLAIAVTGLLAIGCGQAAPPATPTKAPAAPAPTKAAEPTKPAAAPTKAAEPTKAPAAQPTAAPVKKVDFPQKGKAVTVIVPYAPGGASSIATKVLIDQMEKDLGTPFQLVNKEGATSQVGLTEMVQARPDGYTLALPVLPTAITTYLESERKAIYNAKSFQFIGTLFNLPTAITVLSSSPYKTMKDLFDAAKANPGKIKVGNSGFMGVLHLIDLQMEKAAGVEFAIVDFNGNAPAVTAMLGGHIDVAPSAISGILQLVKAGQARVLGLVGGEEPDALPGIPTLVSMGYNVDIRMVGGLAAPGGTPKEVVDVLTGSMKKAMGTQELKDKMKELGYTLQYMDPDQYTAFWNQQEPAVKELMGLARKK